MKDSYLAALHEHRMGNVELAEKLYRSYLVDEPDNADVLHLLAILLASRQDFSQALYYIDSALAVNPNSATLYNSKGNILRSLKRYLEAISHYEKALRLESDNASCHNNLGNAFYSLGNMADAKKHYLEAIRLNPQYAEACYNLSLALARQGLSEEAVKRLEEVLHFEPNHEQAHNSLAYLLQLQGDFDQAIRLYRKAVEISPENVFAHHNLGVILTDKCEYEEGISHFKKVLEFEPRHVEALHNLGAIFLLQKKTTEALACFLRLTELSKDFDAYYNVGVIYSGLGRLKDAIVYFNNALEISPDSFPVHVNLGAVYLQRREFERAREHYLKALQLEPDNEAISYILAAIEQKGIKNKAPAAYLKELFDQYAPYFDRHLGVLDYKVPQLLFDAVQNVLGDKVPPLTVLDLGCGTGLSGDKFLPIANRIIGIDISEKMLEVARSKNIYADLRLASIDEAILEFSNIDVIIAADSLVYFGDLGDIFAKCRSVLKPGGIFAFTLELAETYPYVLERSARFAHSDGYIKELAEQNNFVILQASNVALRKQDNCVINGNMYIFKTIA